MLAPLSKGVEVPPPTPNTDNPVAVGWPDALEELANNSVIADGHRSFMGVVFQGVRSVQTGRNDAIPENSFSP